jgi:hypothetical protein
MYFYSQLHITVQPYINLRGLLPVQVGLYEELAGPVSGQAGTERLQHQVLSLQFTEFRLHRMTTNGCTESRQKTGSVPRKQYENLAHLVTYCEDDSFPFLCFLSVLYCTAVMKGKHLIKF